MFFSSVNCFSKAPLWVFNRPSNNVNFKYYIGRSSGAENESAGFSIAYKNAIQQAVRENYGVKTKLDSQSYATLSKTTFTERIAEVSKNVEIKGFELSDYYIEKLKKGRINIWTLYKYPVSEIQKEKKRLSKLSFYKKNINFSDAGTMSKKAKQTLKITSKPSGAEVYIDGKLLLAETPLKVRLSSGIHSLQIDHKNYKTISEKFVSIEGKTKRLDYILEPAFGYLNITTKPTGARVFRDGEPIGITPLNKIQVRSGEQHMIQIEHPESEKYAQTLSIQKNEIKNINIALPLKSATVFITTEPLDVDVYINGKFKAKTPLKPIILNPGSYNLKFVKKGYEEEIKSFELKGGEKRIVDTVKLFRLPKLKITSEPSGADIYVDGDYFGKTSSSDILIPNSGKHELRISRSEYEDYHTFINIKKGEVFEPINIKLHKTPSWELRPWDFIFGFGMQFQAGDSVSNNLGQYMKKGIDFKCAVEKKWFKLLGTTFGFLITYRNGDKFSNKSFEYYLAMPIYLHSLTSSVNNYLALSPLIGHQPYNNISFDDGDGYKISQYFYGSELEYRYFWIREDKNKIGTGLSIGYKKYSEGLSVILFSLSGIWRF
jgi:hypothetical protein